MQIKQAEPLAIGKLYLLSGAPASGKSTWIEPLKHLTVSTDALRDTLVGHRVFDGKIQRLSAADAQVFNIAQQIVTTRMAEKLTTFVDATLTTEADRAVFAKIAQKAGVPVEVLIFDEPLEVCQARNAQRATTVPDHVVTKFHEKLERTSALPYRLVTSNTYPQLIATDLATATIDVVGDVHGMFDELVCLLETMGYSLETGVPVHPQGRKLLFLGDVVDRGPKSIQVLQLVRRAVAQGHFMVMGNHEHKLVKFWESCERGEPRASSLSAAETAVEFSKLAPKVQADLIKFLRSLPGSLTASFNGQKVAFAHACLTHYDPLTTLHSECMYGSDELKPFEVVDVDALYQANYEKGHNQYLLLRGHIPQTSPQSSVVSLEHGQAFDGHLSALPLDTFLADRETLGTQAALAKNLVQQKCNFNFERHSVKFDLMRGLQGLVRDKMAVVQSDEDKHLRLYKYSKQVFYKALWGASPWLAKARGIVLDLAGNVVVHPFDKVFNYGENGTGSELQDHQDVIAVEKLNGFMGCISKHPHKNQLLLTTTGSFDSPFVQYIRDFVTPELRSSLLKFFAKNNATLMFEVIHPEDPHIIQYEPSQHGLWLIGARELTQHSKLHTEDALDALGVELNLPRPKWYNTTFGALKDTVNTSQLEGFMVRDAQTHETVLKFKTPYYLVTKFLGRLSEGKIKAMYANPKHIKATLDEEFFPLVDYIVANASLAEFMAMSDTDRTGFVRQAIAATR